jgi:hypothetical protein
LRRIADSIKTGFDAGWNITTAGAAKGPPLRFPGECGAFESAGRQETALVGEKFSRKKYRCLYGIRAAVDRG